MRTDPTVLAELEELDRALAGEDSPLTQLVADVRCERPRMEPAFAARLDALVDAARVAPRRPRWLVWSPLAGVAAAVLIALVVVSGGGGQTSPPSAAHSESSGAARSLAQPAPAPLPGPAVVPAGRRVERTTSLALSTARPDVQGVADDVVATTQRFGGIVETSQTSTSDSEASAFFTLRIPTARLDDAIAALSELAHVSSLQQGSTDITSAFTSVQARLADARAERRALLKALARASTTQAIDAIRARLRDNRSQISRLKGDLGALRRRAQGARVDVTVTGNGHASSGGGTWTPGDAARDALRVLEVAAGVILVGLAAGIPAALLLWLAWLGARASRRRRREASLSL